MLSILLEDILPDPENVFTKRDLTVVFGHSMLCDPEETSDAERMLLVQDMLEIGKDEGGLSAEECSLLFALMNGLGKGKKDLGV